ncbi:ABC transporter ATP-binding protein [Streptococcus halichoeri]|uniref:ABC transporter ATP-binding protein n=1 Tax=Streptococcus halichoeri TaxID=254785 RepID=UPI001F2B84B9|nr:ATP-binding cassette domain-containing protein [Streptococcus halichoeri]
MNIKDGEFFTLLGPSGCGRLTTLRCLAGFIEPYSGKIKVNGEDITKSPPDKRNIGLVFQSYALFPSMSVYENIAFGLNEKKISQQIIKAKVFEITRKLNITENQMNHNVTELSGGQEQRVTLARTFVLEPEILCLDEPFSNIDAKLRQSLREELKRLQRELNKWALIERFTMNQKLNLYVILLGKQIK